MVIFYMVLAVIAVATFVVFAAFNIIYLIDLTKTIRTLRQFIVKTENNLIPAMGEVRKATADVSAVTDKVRTATEAVMTIEKNIENLYGYYRKSLDMAANGNMAALKAGLAAGLATLLKNLTTRKEPSP